MGREDHISKLEQKLNSRKVDVDAQSLWNELEPRLPAKRNNRKFAIWIFIGFLSIAASTFYLVNRSDDRIFNQEAMFTGKNKDEIQKEESQKTNDQVKSTHLSQSQSIDNNSQLSTSTLKTEEIQESQFVERVPNKNIQVHKNSAQTTIQRESSNGDLGLKANNRNLSGMGTARTNEINTISSTDENGGPIPERHAIHYTNSKFVSEDSPIESESYRIGYLPRLKATVLTKQNHLATNRLPDIVIVSSDIESRDIWRFSIAVESHLFRSLEKRNNLTGYGALLDDATSLQFGYQNGINVKGLHRAGFILGMGIQRITTLEKFKFQNEFTQIESVVDEEAFDFQGAFISQTEIIQKTITQDVLQYNKLTHINLTPMIGYRLQGRTNFDFSISPLFSILHKGDGYLVDREQVLTSEISSLFNNSGLSFNGLSAQAGISKHIFKNLEMGIQISGWQQRKNTAFDNIDFSRQILSLGAGLHLSYSFN